MEAIAERKKIEYEQRLEREERKKAQDVKKERYKSAAREKKPEPRERNAAADGGESLRKERVKSAVRKTDAPETRQSRHQESRTSEQTPRPKSKSVRRGGEDVVIENKINLEDDKGPRRVMGLSGEMALAAATSKTEKAKIRK